LVNEKSSAANRSEDRESGRPAATQLSEALTRCRRINLVEYEPDILLEWARWYRAKGNTDDAHAHADEALEIADRCEYRLKQADIHNFLALLALDAGDRDLARQHAEIAKERAWCDGPPHCYKPALDQSEAMVKRL
jgi:tetratricopeptide (TPR) repeat protein